MANLHSSLSFFFFYSLLQFVLTKHYFVSIFYSNFFQLNTVFFFHFLLQFLPTKHFFYYFYPPKKNLKKNPFILITFPSFPFYKPNAPIFHSFIVYQVPYHCNCNFVDTQNFYCFILILSKV